VTEIETVESTAPNTEKKTWITPAATVEQVSEVTLAGASPNPDGLGCST
jgi:hypothetical protein